MSASQELSYHPVGDTGWPGSIAHLLSGFAGRLNVYRVMAHHPALLVSWQPFRDHVVVGTSLTPQQHEIVVLRTGVRLESPYEIAHHIARGCAVGLSDERIANVQSAIPRDDSDGHLIAAVDELIDAGQMSIALRDQLARELGIPAVMDIIATVGMYRLLGSFIATFDIPLDAEVAAAATGMSL